MSSVVDLLADLGGVARRRALLAVVARADLEAAVEDGQVVRVARGLYALPGLDEAPQAAAHLGGVLSLTSAALQHGWGVKTVPQRPHVTVSRGRRVSDRRRKATIHRAELPPCDVVDGVTTPARTLLDCLRHLPFDEARGPGARQVRAVASAATALAANPFESTLRAVCLRVPGLRVRPQVTLVDGDFTARADLVDERLRIVCEADSFAWHGNRAALASDARRYNRMVIAGWTVLRFSYEDVMFHPDEAREVLRGAVALAEVLNKRHPGARRAV